MNSVMHFTYANDYFDAGELDEARAHPAIRHYEGPDLNKPWHLLGDREGWVEYRHHRRHTPWPRVRRTGLTPLNVIRHVTPTSRIVPAVVRYRRMRDRARGALLRLLWRAWASTGAPATARLFLINLIVRTGNFKRVTWLGTPIWQNVLDLWTIQETIAEVRPALLIETGTHHGGSALFYANLMDLIGQGHVVTIDIVQRSEVSHPRIDFLHGSSTDPAILQRVRAAAQAASGPVMVILDGNHKRHHVAQELELYAPLVTPGSFILSQDGVIDQVSLFADSRPGPLGANREFLRRHPEFEHDRERSGRFVVTHHPTGWLRRRPDLQ